MGRGRLRHDRPRTADRRALTDRSEDVGTAATTGARVRVGIDVRVPDPSEPGQQRWLWRLGAWLAGEGHACHYLARRLGPAEAGQPADAAEPSAHDVAPLLDGQTPPGTTLEPLAGVGRRGLLRRMAELHLDAVLVNPERAAAYRGWPRLVLRPGYGTDQYAEKLRSFRAGPDAALRRLSRGAPWVVARRRWERALYEAVPAPEVVVQSEAMRARVLDTYRVDPGRVRVVRNGVDTGEFSPETRLARRNAARARWGVAPDETLLAFVGHNYRLKGLWPLLEAVALLEGSTRLRLLVAGRGTGSGQRRKARRLVSRLGLGDRVVLAGPVPHSMEAHAAADALVHPTWHDAFGFVVLEAMACGLPVVTTRHAGASEIVEDGRSGLLVDPAHPRAIADAIRALTDAERRRALGAAARATAADYGEERSFAGVLRALASVAGAPA